MRFQLLFMCILLTYSCKRIQSQQSKIDWKNELIGIGLAGIQPDSLYTIFEYYPCEKNQPDYLILNYPGSTILIDYFYSKFDKDKHLDTKKSNTFYTFRRKEFNKLPRGVENWELNIPPPDL